ncbi:MAG: hypothetical protein BGP06_05805 [Rhizobiales bacterium 65-9]|nr:ComEC/Rec2 family competence protein [Hyphomicrobiales bacterium]OJY35381.1 MAG: hypothetical protein BGP06_05805 [Rhizobiales bacterium 65-9]
MISRGARGRALAIAAVAGRARRSGALAGRFAALAAGWRDALRLWLLAEMGDRRLFLWLPVAMGAGVCLYFAAASEPNIAAPFVGTILFAAAAVAARDRPAAFAVCVGLSAAMAGFFFACLRTMQVAAPRVARVMTVEVAGYIEARDDRAEGARMVVRVVSIEGLAAADTPYRVRVTTRSRPLAVAGDFIKMKARLQPPPEPPRPGAYDFARDAFYKRVGAVGHAPGQVGPALAAPPPPWDLRLFAAIDRKRNELTDRIIRAIGGQPGALGAALVTGKRDLITEDTNDALRAAGVYHIVSVSGLHMVLAAGAFFWTVRAILALFPMVALAWPVKKIGAVLAMLGATGYCLFTGSEVATERSLIMILVMLGAILADRPALAMRNLAIAALITLAREPETLLGPSFQMSFAAVAGLIALTEWRRDHAPQPGGEPSGPILRISGHLREWVVMLFVTTAVATFATAPYSAFHFQRLNPWGLLGNALALPFVSFIVMPAAVVGVLLWPFGLDGWVWRLMGIGAEPVIAVSQAVAGLSGSVSVMRAFGSGALLLATLALLWFTLWRTPLRWGALPLAAAGLLAMMRAEPADFYLARSGQGAAYRAADGKLVVLGDASRFDVQFWLQADGDIRPATDPSLKTGTACDRLGCVGTDRAGRIVAWVRDARAFPEDCRRATFIITPLPAPGWCSDPLIADRKTFDDYGAIVLKFRSGDDVDLRGTRAPDERRTWQAPIRAAPPVAQPPRAADARPPAHPAPLPGEDGDPDQ